MEEKIITFDTAKLAKEKGFANNSSPTQSLLQKWLWEKHTIWVQSTPLFSSNEMFGIHVTVSSWKFPIIVVDYNGYDVYEGFEKGLQESLKLITDC